LDTTTTSVPSVPTVITCPSIYPSILLTPVLRAMLSVSGKQQKLTYKKIKMKNKQFRHKFKALIITNDDIHIKHRIHNSPDVKVS